MREVGLSWVLVVVAVSVTSVFFHFPGKHFTSECNDPGSLNAMIPFISGLGIFGQVYKIIYLPYVSVSVQHSPLQCCCSRGILIHFSCRTSLRQRRYLVKNQSSIY